MKERIHRQNFKQLKIMPHDRHYKEHKKITTNMVKMFAKDTSNKGLLLKVSKELTQFNYMKTMSLKEEPKTSRDNSPRKHSCGKQTKRHPTSCVSGNCNLIHETPKTLIRMAKTQNTDTTKHWERCGAVGSLTHCWWKCKMV
jgi:hypothetical protein